MKKYLLVATLLGISGTSNAGIIMATGDTNIGSNGQFFSNVFGGEDVLSLNTGTSAWNTSNFTNTVDNYTSSFSAVTDLTSSINSNFDWLIAGTNTLYTNTQLTFISEFMNNGGNIFIAGERAYYASERNAANQLLDYLGSSIDVVDSFFSGTSSALIANAYTLGAPTFSYDYSANLKGGTGLYGVNDTYYNVAFEDFSVEVSVPEPSSVALLALGLAGLGFSRRKSKA